MKILLLIHEFPPIGGGGGRIAQTIARYLASCGHEMIVLTDKTSDLSKDPVEENLQIVRINSFRKVPFMASFLNMLFYIAMGFFKGLKIIQREKPEIIHVHFAVPAGALAFLLTKVTGIPYVLTTHLGDIPGGNPEKTSGWFKWVKPFTPMIWKNAKVVTSVSSWSKGLAEQHYDVPIQIIPNCTSVIPTKIGDIRVTDIPQLVFAGRFVEQKNLFFLLEVLKKIKNKNWHCTLIGDGEHKEKLQSIIDEEGMQSKFSFTGWIEPEEVTRIFRNSDIFVLPSIWEGMPIAGLQALASGLAIVSAFVGGMDDRVEQGGNGYLLERDVQSWADRLNDLLDDRGRLLSFKKYSLTKASEFSVESVGNQYETIFNQILEN